MRFILAAVAFVASVVLLVIGGVQFAQASNVNEVTASGTTTSAAPLAVITSETLASHAGGQSVEIRGEGELIVAVGRTDDVMAWVGDTSHTLITVDETAESQDHNLQLQFAESGSEPTAPAPAGNDLWFEQHTGENVLELDLLVSPGYSMLIASNGTEPALTEVTISWPFSGYAPMVGPLLTAGAILMVVAIALLIWALMHRRQVKSDRGRASGRQPGSGVDTIESMVEEWTPVQWQAAPSTVGSTDAPEPAAASESVQAEPADAELADAELADVEPVDAEPARDAELADAELAGDAEPAEEHHAGEEARVTVDAPVGSSAQEGSPFAPPTESSAGDESPEAQTESELDAQSEVDALAEPDVVTEPKTEPETEPESEPETEPETEPEADAAGPADDEKKWRRPRGRDRTQAPKRMFFAAPIMAFGMLTLAGCAPQFWPADWTDTEIRPTGTPTSTVDAAILDEGAHPPALNDAQLAEVIADVTALANEADAALDPGILDPRFSGAALAERSALYEAKTANEEMTGPAPFPDGDLLYAVPEASAEWPSVVFAVLNPGENAPEGSTPTAMMLVQASPRDNFKVDSLVPLASNVTLPEAAPMSVGAPGLAELEGQLVMAPSEIAAAYADVIANGDESEYAEVFDATNDMFRESVNDAYRAGLTEQLDPEVVSISFDYAATDTAPTGVGVLDGGAIVAVSMQEIERLESANDRALITVSGRTAVLSGVETSEFGFERTYTDQLLFYVPSAETGGPIQFLGVSQEMTDAQELTE